MNRNPTLTLQENMFSKMLVKIHFFVNFFICVMGIDYGFYTFVTSCVILLVQLHLVSKSAGWLSISSEFVPGPDYNEKVAHVPEMSISGRHVKKVVERNGMLVYEDGDIPHPSYVNVAPLTEKQAELDIMAELSKLRIAANTQKEVLIAANRMPPETAVSRMIADRTRAYMLEDELGTSLLPGCSSISELPLYLSRQYPNGIGVILGVGKGSFVLSLLKGWVTMGGLYLVDPYIHIYKGYDNEGNVDDRTHQLIYENLRNDIVKIGTSQNKYAFIRDFSFECMSKKCLHIFC